MNATAKSVCGYVIGSGIVVCFIVLLTVIFSFVGTLICAALAGMMLGAAQLSRWPSLATSLVFPAVISVVLRVSKADLSGRQVLFLAVLCFGVFWVIYAAVWALVAQEQAKPKAATAARVHSLERVGSRATAPILEPAVGQERDRPPVPSPGSPATKPLTLAILEGNWLCPPGSNGSTSHKAMEIHGDTMAVSLTDGNGGVHSVFKARLKLGPAGLAVDDTVRPEVAGPELLFCI